METELHSLKMTVRRLCRKMESVEDKVDTISHNLTAFSRNFDVDGLKDVMATLKEVVSSALSINGNDQKITRVPSTTAKTHKIPSQNYSPRSRTASVDDEQSFPSVTARKMWRLWFRGGKKGIPYSTLGDQLANPAKQKFKRAKYLMRVLVDLAIENNWVASNQELQDLTIGQHESLFDKVFHAMLGVTDGETITHPCFKNYNLDEVENLSYSYITQRLGQVSKHNMEHEDGSSSDEENHVQLLEKKSEQVAQANKDASPQELQRKLRSRTTAQFSPANSLSENVCKSPVVSASPSVPHQLSPEAIQQHQSQNNAIELPSVSCRLMWFYWFYGNPDHPVLGPYRFLYSPSLFSGVRCRKRFYDAKRTMNSLIGVAVENNLAKSADEIAKLPRSASEKVYEEAMKLYFKISEDGISKRPGYEGRTFEQVLQMTYIFRGRKVPQETNEDPDMTNLLSTNENVEESRNANGLDFPSVNSFDLWKLWFFGDGRSDGRPFRLRYGYEFQEKKMRRRFNDGKRLMQIYISEAINLQLAPDEESLAQMSISKSTETFNAVFAHYLGKKPDGTLSRSGFEDRTYNQAAEMRFSSIQRIPYPKKSQAIDNNTSSFESSTTIQSSCNAVFTWSDGSNRNAPENWEFPELCCRDLWHSWFFGNKVLHIGPFRLLVPFDVESSPKSCQRLSFANIIMGKLLDIADKYMFLAPDERLETMPMSDSMVVFDRAFDLLMHNNPEGNMAGLDDDQIPPEKADECSFILIAMKLQALLESPPRKRLRYDV